MMPMRTRARSSDRSGSTSSWNSSLPTIRDLATSPTPTRFDFGTASSPLASGYTRVTAATPYSAATGFGWLAGTIADYDRGTGTDLTRYFNYTADGTFAVDLPNGTYSVALSLGDVAHLHDQQGVYLEGVQVDTVDTASGEVATRTYTVTVADPMALAAGV